MSTPRRRPHFATGAFLLPACLAALSALAFSGCSVLPKRKAPPPAEPVLIAPKHVEVGRILSYDADDATAVIEFSPHFRSAIPAAGTPLIARKLDTLEPTARLTAAPYRNNRTLGAYVVSGHPRIDDEVVIAPEPVASPQSSAPASASPALSSRSVNE
jgi:hypothetical protein